MHTHLTILRQISLWILGSSARLCRNFSHSTEQKILKCLLSYLPHVFCGIEGFGKPFEPLLTSIPVELRMILVH